MPRYKLNTLSTQYKNVQAQQVELIDSKSHHFLYVPVLISCLALLLILSPAMANESKVKLCDCSYDLQHNQMKKMNQLKKANNSNLIRITAGIAPLEIQKTVAKTYIF